MLPLPSIPAASYLFQTKVSPQSQLLLQTTLVRRTYWGVTQPTTLPPVGQ